LGGVVDGHVLAVLDVVSGGGVPGVGEDG
jgi:hypothetical protein